MYAFYPLLRLNNGSVCILLKEYLRKFEGYPGARYRKYGNQSLVAYFCPWLISWCASFLFRTRMNGTDIRWEIRREELNQDKGRKDNLWYVESRSRCRYLPGGALLSQTAGSSRFLAAARLRAPSARIGAFSAGLGTPAGLGTFPAWFRRWSRTGPPSAWSPSAALRTRSARKH